ncbi:hypothetical protein ATH84_10562 [Paracoccus versutus]|uniref:Uncharacterized protein n=1 Tax=Paracoccus versutus TaxID=34007 RepID=A0AAQ0HD78_PARVE|nr:hypothetical protein ATH84_10562 [Paracoccus versutus]
MTPPPLRSFSRAALPPGAACAASFVPQYPGVRGRAPAAAPGKHPRGHHPRGKEKGRPLRSGPSSRYPSRDHPMLPEGPRLEAAAPKDHFRIFDTTPAPTVRPPSRMAKRSFSSIAIGAISSTVNFRLSPGITISVPSGSFTVPVTSVVRK